MDNRPIGFLAPGGPTRSAKSASSMKMSSIGDSCAPYGPRPADEHKQMAELPSDQKCHTSVLACNTAISSGLGRSSSLDILGLDFARKAFCT